MLPLQQDTIICDISVVAVTQTGYCSSMAHALFPSLFHLIQIVKLICFQWIPIIYYGTEQAYNGGNDPDNRLSLWPNFNTNHMMYKVSLQMTRLRFLRTVGSFCQLL